MTYQLNVRTLYNRDIIHATYDTYKMAYYNGAALLQIKRIKAFSIDAIPAPGERLTNIKSRFLK